MDEIMRVLVAEGCTQTLGALDRALSVAGHAVYPARAGDEALLAIDSLLPDALVLAMALPRLDGLGVLAALNARALPRYPFVVAISAMGEGVLEAARRAGADLALRKPVDGARLGAWLAAARQGAPPDIARRHAALREDSARAQLDEMGMSRQLKGYRYLAEAVALVSVEAGLLHQATKRLYPLLAQRSGDASGNVERAIRHAIETTWTHGRVQTLHRVFGNSIDPQRGKPTNTECIARLANRVGEGR